MGSKDYNRLRPAYSHANSCSVIAYIKARCKGPNIGIVVLVLQTPQCKVSRLIESAPLNHVVKYKTIRQDGEDRSPYVSSEPPVIDKMWMDLYDCKYPSSI